MFIQQQVILKLTFWCRDAFFFFKGCISNSASLKCHCKNNRWLDFLCLCFHSSGSMTFSHTNACVFCVRSRNPPSSSITDPKWICCSWTKTLGCFGPVAEDCATCYICRDHQRPHQTNTRQHRYEPANNKTSTATATLATFGNNRFSLFVRPLYVLDMWKIERKHIFILLYRWEKWNQGRIGTLFTLLKQKKTKKKVMRKGLTFFCTIGLCSQFNYGQKDGARCLPSSVEVSTFTLLTRREEAFQTDCSLSGLTQHFSGAQSLSKLI